MQLHHYTQLYNSYATKDLELLLHSAPYFGAGHIVLAKKYYTEKNIAFNEQLKLASLYTADRKVLYSFIQQSTVNTIAVANEAISLVNETTPIITEIETPKPPVVVDNSAMHLLAQSILIADSVQLYTTRTNAQLAQLVNEVLLNESTSKHNNIRENIVITQKIEPRTIEQKAVPIIKLTVPIIEPTVIADEVTNVMAIDESIEKNTVAAEKEVIIPTKEIIETPNLVNTPEAELQKTTPIKNYKAININDTVSFFDWLNISVNSVIETNFQQITTPIVPINNLEVPKITFEEKNTAFKNRKKTLIEKFILDEPRITPGKAKMYSPSEKAKESIVENEDLVSETLVNIYIKQGLYRKAIKSLDKLIEKYPKKSAYFAKQILTINEYLITNNIKY